MNSWSRPSVVLAAIACLTGCAAPPAPFGVKIELEPNKTVQVVITSDMTGAHDVDTNGKSYLQRTVILWPDGTESSCETTAPVNRTAKITYGTLTYKTGPQPSYALVQVFDKPEASPTAPWTATFTMLAGPKEVKADGHPGPTAHQDWNDTLVTF